MPIDLLMDTMKVKYDELPQQIPNPYQTTDKWLAQRKLCVTSSNSGTIWKGRGKNIIMNYNENKLHVALLYLA